MIVSNFLHLILGGSVGALRGWDREPQKLWPTLQRNGLDTAWGFSLVGGLDYLDAAGRYSGIVTKKGEVGLWLKVSPNTFLVNLWVTWHKVFYFSAFEFYSESPKIWTFWMPQGGIKRIRHKEGRGWTLA